MYGSRIPLTSFQTCLDIPGVVVFFSCFTQRTHFLLYFRLQSDAADVHTYGNHMSHCFRISADQSLAFLPPAVFARGPADVFADVLKCHAATEERAQCTALALLAHKRCGHGRGNYITGRFLLLPARFLRHCLLNRLKFRLLVVKFTGCCYVRDWDSPSCRDNTLHRRRNVVPTTIKPTWH